MSETDLTSMLSPASAALVAGIRAQGFPGWAFLTLEQARAFMATLEDLAGPSNFSGVTRDVRVSAQPEVTGRLYIPDTPTPPRVLVYFHGGGFMVGTADDYDGVIRRLSQESGLAVLSVNYRLAPEHESPQRSKMPTRHLAGLGKSAEPRVEF